MAKSSQVLLVTLIIFITKPYVIKGNENLFVSKHNTVYYIESEQKFTFYDSLVNCVSMNMSLVTIDNKYKSQEITDLLHDIFGKKLPLWIGGTVNGVNPRQFMWISTARKFTYTNWADGQPDFAGHNEYCLLAGWNNAMEWNDQTCSNKFGFMCEYSHHQCQEEILNNFHEEMRKQQEIELKQTVVEMLPVIKNVDGENRTINHIVVNINVYNP